MTIIHWFSSHKNNHHVFLNTSFLHNLTTTMHRADSISTVERHDAKFFFLAPRSYICSFFAWVSYSSSGMFVISTLKFQSLLKLGNWLAGLLRSQLVYTARRVLHILSVRSHLTFLGPLCLAECSPKCSIFKYKHH